MAVRSAARSLLIIPIVIAKKQPIAIAMPHPLDNALGAIRPMIAIVENPPQTHQPSVRIAVSV